MLEGPSLLLEQFDDPTHSRPRVRFGNRTGPQAPLGQRTSAGSPGGHLDANAVGQVGVLEWQGPHLAPWLARVLQRWGKYPFFSSVSSKGLSERPTRASAKRTGSR